MSKIINQKYLSYLILIFPPALSVDLLPDLIISVSSIYFVLFLLISKNLNYLNNDFVKIFYLLYIYRH